MRLVSSRRIADERTTFTSRSLGQKDGDGRELVWPEKRATGPDKPNVTRGTYVRLCIVSAYFESLQIAPYDIVKIVHKGPEGATASLRH